MEKLVHFTRPDGKDCAGYLVNPAEGESRPAVVVIQEWWGLNAQIRKIADRLAEAGFRALVPDLYRGKLAKDADEAGHMMNGLNFMDAAEQDIRGAVQFLKKKSPQVATCGFCMGGALTILSALRVPELSAGVVFYGMPPTSVGDPSQIAIPMSYHYAKVDDWCSKERVDALETAVKASKYEHVVHRYDAQHAFMNEARPEVYDAACAKLAWGRMVEFLGRTIA